ncbi:hypothetical protein V2H45_16515 [Tumidithrix elongata RA019]|uniref:Uncharacterized protein n=1 Tax=Tumidithrix elongata BACA0141 TaxID=2716417 RepID=A0AAW9Q4H4_9CYAN|nr:hypothetical protein [Tumidithrix elongata RA019]
MSFLPKLQKYIRNTNVPRQLVRSPGYDEQLGFGDKEPRLSSAKLLEASMRAIPVGECTIPENQFAYFLDGIQRSWLLYYQDYVPVYYGYTAAVIRQRHEALLAKWEHQTYESLYVPFCYFDPAELIQLRSQELPVTDTKPKDVNSSAQDETSDEGEDMQPMALREAARNTISNMREKNETDLAEAWIQADLSGWLVMDGSISISRIASEHPRVVGLIKSHNTQYFRFPAQEIILNLKFGERSSVFQPPSRNPVCSWYLRLREGMNEDMHFGLIRVEASLSAIDRVDEISRWILTERRPLSLPDSRWDKMIYPIRDCEMFLRSHEPSRATFGWLN